jgi:hypothetical protein
VQAGLDVIKTLSSYYNFYPMIFVDNREGIVSVPKMDAQMIGLVVSEKDATLRIESL